MERWITKRSLCSPLEISRRTFPWAGEGFVPERPGEAGLLEIPDGPGYGGGCG